MPRLSLLLALVLVIATSAARAQTEVWLKVDHGHVLILSAGDPEWTPSGERQRVPVNSFLLTGEEAEATLFRATESFDVPSGSYVFVDDVFPKSRMELVDALTRIEAAQLPGRGPAEAEPDRPLGLTYGSPSQSASTTSGEVPYEAERRRTVAHFYALDRFDAALLSLKRSMTKFPELYEDDATVELLLDLYGRFQLYGFMLDECDRLLNRPQAEPVAAVLQHWRDIAEEALAMQRR